MSQLFKLFMDALYIDQYPLVLEVIGEEQMEDSSISMIHVSNRMCCVLRTSSLSY